MTPSPPKDTSELRAATAEPRPRTPHADPGGAAHAPGTGARAARWAQPSGHPEPSESPEALEPPDPLSEVTAKIKRALIMAELEREQSESPDDPYNSGPGGAARDPWSR